MASHRRWHKPRQGSLSHKSVIPGTLKPKQKPAIRPNENINSDCQVGNFICKDCGKAFRRLVIILFVCKWSNSQNFKVIWSTIAFFFAFKCTEWPTSKSMQSFTNIQYAKWKKDWIYWNTINWYPAQMAAHMWQFHLNLCYLMPNNVIYTKSVSFTINNKNACQPFNLYNINGLKNKLTKGINNFKFSFRSFRQIDCHWKKES